MTTDQPGLERTLDAEQARDRAAAHSARSALHWHIVRTPRGHHVVLSGHPNDTYGAGYTIVATYYHGKES